jgi:hypothetical protein
LSSGVVFGEGGNYNSRETLATNGDHVSIGIARPSLPDWIDATVRKLITGRSQQGVKTEFGEICLQRTVHLPD